MAEDVAARALGVLVKAIRPGERVKSRPGAPLWYQDHDTRWVIASYSRDFEALWGLTDGAQGLDAVVRGLWARSTPLNLVVVWDRVPGVGGAVQDYVTAFDWALALSRALYLVSTEGTEAESPDSRRLPRIRLLILDMAPLPHGRSFGVSHLPLMRTVLPWIQAYRPATGGDATYAEAALVDLEPEEYAFTRQIIPLESFEASHLVEDLLEPARVSTTFEDDVARRRAYLDGLAETWRHHLLRDRGRHAVANLVAPIVLAWVLPSAIREDARRVIEEGLSARRAFTVLLEGLGLLPNPRLEREGAVAEAANTSGPLVREDQPLKFLLVDDQYALGYQHILGYTLFGGEYRPSDAAERGGVWQLSRANGQALKAVSGVRHLLDALVSGDRTFEWSTPRLSRPLNCDVVLLDLRLWEEDGDRERRVKVLAAVIEKCDELRASENTDRVLAAALAGARNVAAGGTKGDLEALALLPLLLSHYDPSLPIVLFSSTRQRTVIEALAHRPSIITEFAKPILRSYGDLDGPADHLTALYRAVGRAAEMVELRRIWERICRLTLGEPPRVQVYRTIRQDTPPWAIDRARLGGPQKSHFAVEAAPLRAQLGILYQDYILRERFVDFLSVPRELIEGLLAPSQEIPEPAPTEYYSWPIHRGPHRSRERRRAVLADALRICRNAKVHDFWIGVPADKWLLTPAACSHLCFSALLDFLEGNESSEEEDQGAFRWLSESAWKEVSNEVARRAGWNDDGTGLDPERIRAHALDPGSFVALTFCWAAYHAADNPRPVKSTLSRATRGLLFELLSKMNR